MEISAKLNNAPLSAQKARLVGDQIRGLPVDKALNVLKFFKCLYTFPRTEFPH